MNSKHVAPSHLRHTGLYWGTSQSAIIRKDKSLRLNLHLVWKSHLGHLTHWYKTEETKADPKRGEIFLSPPLFKKNWYKKFVLEDESRCSGWEVMPNTDPKLLYFMTSEWDLTINYNTPELPSPPLFWRPSSSSSPSVIKSCFNCSVVVPSRNSRPQQLDPEPLSLLCVLLRQRDSQRRWIQLHAWNKWDDPRMRHVLQLHVSACGRVKGEDKKLWRHCVRYSALTIKE